MTFRERIYDYSPIAVQNWMVSSYGRKLIRQRYAAEYKRALKYYLDKPYDSLSAERELQLRETKRLLAHAIDCSSFYRNLYRDIDVGGIASLGDLKQLPAVDKEELRSNIQDVYTVSRNSAIEAFTGGTMGKSLVVRFLPEDFQKRMAYLDAFKVRCGTDPHRSTKATFSGRAITRGYFQRNKEIFWRDNRPYNQRLYSTFDIRPENIPSYISNLNQFVPDIVNGFVSAISQIAEFSLRNNVPIEFKPKAIFTTSETLLPIHRASIEKAFGAKVFDQYASAEGAPFVTECIAGNMHYNIDTGVIEVHDFGGGPEMLVTSFTSYGTPLIRYRIGDSITFMEGACPCGNCHPLVERIEGRRVDYLLSSDGRRVSLSHLADVIKGLPNSVIGMQFIQEAIDEITIRVVVDESRFGMDSERMILDEMGFRFGDSTTFHIERVAEIERESSGKQALIKNNTDGPIPAE